ncbi:MAG: hypothetical protein M5U33_06485 [Pseudorhodoplanes sp.]|nr:hypothetical protein [Pseudorhodoplanes sp.]
MSQMAVRCESRSVVTMKSLRPVRYSAAMASSVAASTYFAISARSGPALNRPVPEQTADAFELEEVLHLAAGENLPQHLVVAGTEKCEWRHQRAGAGPGHDMELRTRATLAPAGEKACAEGAVGAAARQRQHDQLAGIDAGIARGDVGIVGPYPGIGKARDHGFGLLFRGVGDALYGRARRKRQRAERKHNR